MSVPNTRQRYLVRTQSVSVSLCVCVRASVRCWCAVGRYIKLSLSVFSRNGRTKIDFPPQVRASDNTGTTSRQPFIRQGFDNMGRDSLSP